MARRDEPATALVTGCWDETAAMTAHLMADEGMRLVLAGPDVAAMRRTARQIHRFGGSARVIELPDEGWGAQAANPLEDPTEHGKIDVLCLSPFPGPELHDMPSGEVAGFAQVFPHVGTSLLPMLACLPHMMRQNFGRIIVNVSDAGGRWVDARRLRVSLLAQVLGTFVGLLGTVLKDYDITINVLLPDVGSTRDPEARALAILHLAGAERGGLTGHVVRLASVERAGDPYHAPPAGRGLHLDENLSSVVDLCYDAMREFESRMN